MRLISLDVEGETARQFEIELAENQPDWWAFLDLEPFRGRRVMIRIDDVPQGSRALESIEQGDVIRGAENLYREKLRPQFHFSSRRGWNNDPNGLVYYEGEYHLFYQHNPFGWKWGNMHWGHAVSTDLVHWRELGDALHPDALGTIFSGSAVVDLTDTAGFQKGTEKPIICIYTAAGNTNALSEGRPFTQCIAYSTDRGRTFTKYSDNPVLDHIVAENRDPKVIWYAPESKWIMALYLDENDFALFASADLKHWERLSAVNLLGASECPEFFEIPVEGASGDSRWVFYGGNGLYLVGDFDGIRFTPESGPHPLNFGNCFYASQTFNNIPASDGRRILMPWGRLDSPGMPFNQMIGLPVELTLRTTPEGPRLFTNPVRELESLRTVNRTFPGGSIAPGENPLDSVEGELFDILLDIEPGRASEIILTIRGVTVSYNVSERRLTCLDRSAPLEPVRGGIRLRLLVDRTTIDIFGNQGRVYMPMGVQFSPENIGDLALQVRGGPGRIRQLEVYHLNSIWD